MNGFKRCAVVDIVPTGSYQATLTQISLYRIGCKGFSFRTLGFEQVVLCPCVVPVPCPFVLLPKWCTRWYSPVLTGYEKNGVCSYSTRNSFCTPTWAREISSATWGLLLCMQMSLDKASDAENIKNMQFLSSWWALDF